MFLTDCGLGSDPTSTGPCTGTYTNGHDAASQAGAKAFAGVHSAGIVTAILGAGLLLAGLGFVVWCVRKVASMFGGGPQLGTMEHADMVLRDLGERDRQWRKGGDSAAADNLRDTYDPNDDECEADEEDADEDDGELEHDEAHALEYRA